MRDIDMGIMSVCPSVFPSVGHTLVLLCRTVVRIVKLSNFIHHLVDESF